MEMILAEIWLEFLQLKQIGIHDNFFELGGHSLTAVVVTGKIRSAIAPSFPLRAILDHPTIAELSREIEQLLAAGRQPQKPACPPIVRSRMVANAETPAATRAN